MGAPKDVEVRCLKCDSWYAATLCDDGWGKSVVRDGRRSTPTIYGSCHVCRLRAGLPSVKPDSPWQLADTRTKPAAGLEIRRRKCF